MRTRRRGNIFKNRQVIKGAGERSFGYEQLETRINPSTIANSTDGIPPEEIRIVEGVKFEDRNSDGERSSTERGLEGWTIYADNNDNSQLDDGERHTVTGEQGRFRLELPRGAHVLREVQQDGWVQTAPANGAVEVSLADADVGDIQFGNFKLGAIVGTKYNDLNGNGRRDQLDITADPNSTGILPIAEPGLAEWTIYIDANDNGALDDDERSTETDLLGRYHFDDVGPGTHVIREVHQDGWIQTGPHRGEHVVRMTSGAHVGGRDFGNFELGAISGIKFEDLNGNGRRDGANTTDPAQFEPGLEGWTIYIDRNFNGELDTNEPSVETDANGRYRFAGIGPGLHVIREVNQEGWFQTAPVHDAHFVFMTSGTNVEGRHFGNTQAGVISGVKYEDINGNGERDLFPGLPLPVEPNESGVGDLTFAPPDLFEPGIASWRIYLDLNENGELDDDEPVRETNEHGRYLFFGLEPGVYHVREVQEDGWVQTDPGDAGFHVIDLPADGPVRDADFGNFELGTIAGVKFEDINGNGRRDGNSTTDPNAVEPGLEGWRIYLDLNNNEELDDNEPVRETDGDGRYVFRGLRAGRYTVREVQQPGWIQSAPHDGAHQILVHSGTEIGHLNFGNVPLGVITGFKFEDINGNGERDVPTPNEDGTVDPNNSLFEPTLAGWRVYLDLNENGALDDDEPVRTTNHNGRYLFSGLEPGVYHVREVNRDGWRQTFPETGVHVVDLGEPAVEREVNFGNFELGVISGVKFNDVNGNGLHDAIFIDPLPIDPGPGNPDAILPPEFREPGIEGWRIYLDLNNNEQLDPNEPVRETDEHGRYMFRGLEAGIYHVREVQRDGWVQTAPSDLTHEVRVRSGTEVQHASFGNFELVSIAGVKYHDLNGNGQRDGAVTGAVNAVEPGLEGWTIYIDVNNNREFDNDEPHAITNEHGRYRIDDIGPGLVHVREVQQPGWRQTDPGNGGHKLRAFSGAEYTRINFGNVESGTITGIKFEDVNGNGRRDFLAIDLAREDLAERLGIPLAEVHLESVEAEVFSDGCLGAAEPNEACTDALVPGHAILLQVENRLFEYRTASLDSNFIRLFDFEDRNWFVEGETRPAEGPLEGFVIFVDLNRNNQFDSTEPHGRSDENGRYVINNVPPGEHFVTEVARPGWVLTAPANGGHVVEVASGAEVRGVHFGNHKVASNRPPRIVDVAVHGVNWQSNERFHSIPVGSGKQLHPLPWGEITHLRIGFSEDVDARPEHFRLLSRNGIAPMTTEADSFDYGPGPNGDIFYAILKFEEPISGGHYRLDISDEIVDTAGVPLDGEWDNPTHRNDPASDTYPSGDGEPGGNFRFRFNVLPGDSNRDGLINVIDVLLTRLRIGADCSSGSDEADINRDGICDAIDALLNRLRVGRALDAIVPDFDTLAATANSNQNLARVGRSAGTSSDNQEDAISPSGSVDLGGSNGDSANSINNADLLSPAVIDAVLGDATTEPDVELLTIDESNDRTRYGADSAVDDEADELFLLRD